MLLSLVALLPWEYKKNNDQAKTPRGHFEKFPSFGRTSARLDPS